MKRYVLIILFGAGLFGLGYWAAQRGSGPLRAQKVATYMSGSWERTDDGTVSVLIPNYPDHLYYILVGAYQDVQPKVTSELGEHIARRIQAHGDEKGFVLYVVEANGKVYNAELYVPSFGESSIFTPIDNVIIAKNSPSGPNRYKRLTLIDGSMSRTK